MSRAQPPNGSTELVDSVADALIITRPDGTVVSWNAAATALYGWAEEEALGRSILELTPAPEAGEVAADIMSQLAHGTAWAGEFMVRRRDGSRFRARVVDIPVMDDNGELVAIVGLSRDVTDDAVVLEILRDRLAALETALGAGRLGTWRWDLATGMVAWDEMMEQLYGLEPGTFDGTLDAFLERVHPDDRLWVTETIGAAADKAQELGFEHRALRPDGTIGWFEGRGRPVFRDGVLSGMVGVGVDVSDRRRAQEEIANLTARLQAGLLPDIPARLHAEVLYQPGEQRLLLGGDFYDVVELPDGAVCVVVGDVAGHGPAAAALGANIRASWRALVLQGMTPAATLTGLDRVVRCEDTPERFVTACVAQICPDGSAAVVATAGHPPPILVAPQAATVIAVPPGPPLGLDGLWADHAIALEPGAVLFLHTDGIVEGVARPGSSERWGIERLVDLLRHDGATRSLTSIEDAAAAANGGPLADDVVLLRIAPGTSPD